MREFHFQAPNLLSVLVKLSALYIAGCRIVRSILHERGVDAGTFECIHHTPPSHHHRFCPGESLKLVSIVIPGEISDRCECFSSERQSGFPARRLLRAPSKFREASRRDVPHKHSTIPIRASETERTLLFFICTDWNRNGADFDQ